MFVNRNARFTVNGILLVMLLSISLALPAAMPDFSTLVEQQRESVVSIRAIGKRGGENSPFSQIPKNSPFYEYFKRFFDHMPRSAPRRAPSSIGSGFIISSDGYILTNAHVVDEMEEIIVGLSDQRELKASVVGLDKRSDVALLKIKASGLPAVTVGDVDNLRVGQWVLAIGSPFGFEYTATQGIISALGRSLPNENYVPFIQTDVAVNPGNSGGPLFDLQGRVIGINSQIYSRTGGYQGVSFAIPINVAMDVAGQLKTRGRVSRGWLGVYIQQVTAQLAKAFGLNKPGGALIGQVMPNGPAGKAGLKDGDIIIDFNGKVIEESSELPPLVGAVHPGSTVPVTVIRNGQRKVLKVKIEELPDENGVQASVTEGANNPLKAQVQDQDGEPGVQVVQVAAGPAAEAGIRQGDVILSLNNMPVNNTRQYAEAMSKLPVGRPFPVLVQRKTPRGTMTTFLPLMIPGK